MNRLNNLKLEVLSLKYIKIKFETIKIKKKHYLCSWKCIFLSWNFEACLKKVLFERQFAPTSAIPS